jgi:hypothetical protein
MNMNSYKKTPPLFSSEYFILAFLCLALAALLIYITIGSDNYWFIICAGLSSALLVVVILNIIPTFQKFVFANGHLSVFFGKIHIRDVEYSIIKGISISNAVYTVKNGDLFLKQAQGKTIVDQNGKKIFNQYPYVTLHSTKDFIEKLKPFITSLDVLWYKPEFILYGFYCWFDALKDLVNHVNADVYILEDTFLRFRPEFEDIILNSALKSNLYIISDTVQKYESYV